jgi:hypothetical protein
MSHKTYRVQGIPATYNIERCRILLNSILEGDSQNSEPIIHSLGMDPSSSLENRFQTATVTFKKDPKTFQDKKDDWLLPVTRSRSLHSRATSSSIKFDSNFLGFTPLNSFEDNSEHKME